jgi:hypothetical protein
VPRSGLVVNRKTGNRVFHAVCDPLIVKISEPMPKYFSETPERVISLLEEAKNSR